MVDRPFVVEGEGEKLHHQGFLQEVLLGVVAWVWPNYGGVVQRSSQYVFLHLCGWSLVECTARTWNPRVRCPTCQNTSLQYVVVHAVWDVV